MGFGGVRFAGCSISPCWDPPEIRIWQCLHHFCPDLNWFDAFHQSFRLEITVLRTLQITSCSILSCESAIIEGEDLIMLDVPRSEVPEQAPGNVWRAAVCGQYAVDSPVRPSPFLNNFNTFNRATTVHFPSAHCLVCLQAMSFPALTNTAETTGQMRPRRILQENSDVQNQQ